MDIDRIYTDIGQLTDINVVQVKVRWHLYVRALVVASLLSLICSITHADRSELIPIVLNIKAKAAKKEKLVMGGQYFSLEQFHGLTAADAEEWIQMAFDKIDDPKLLIEKVDGVERLCGLSEAIQGRSSRAMARIDPVCVLQTEWALGRHTNVLGYFAVLACRAGRSMYAH